MSGFLSTSHVDSRAEFAAKLHTYPTAGHVPMEGLPAETAADAERFLAAPDAVP